MKVIGAGLPRSATSTQAVVFEQLGFGPCNHMRNMLMDLEGTLPLWNEALAGRPDWERIFGDAQSCADWPAAYFWRELMDYYPDSKIVLTEREGQSWVRSMRETVWAMYFGDSVIRHVCGARRQVDELWDGFQDLMTRMCWDDGAPMAGNTFDDDAFAEVMRAYNERVKATVPADRLLVWWPTDGWAPLCEFLEVPTPEGEVPHINDMPAFKEGIIGGGLSVLNDWWDQRERPKGGLHGAPVES